MIISYSKKIFFIHIPKCGGTSFLEILKNWFGKKLYLHYYDEKTITKPKKLKLKKTFSNSYISDLCIHGHFNKSRGFGISDYYPGIKQFITILRDPVEMQISRYFHWKKQIETGNDLRDGQKIYFEYKNIDDFLDKTNSAMLLHFPKEITNDNYVECIDSNFIHIGVINDLQNSVNKIADKLRKPRIAISHNNPSERTENPSASTIKRFMEKSKLEYKIYNYALKLND